LVNIFVKFDKECLAEKYGWSRHLAVENDKPSRHHAPDPFYLWLIRINNEKEEADSAATGAANSKCVDPGSSKDKARVNEAVTLIVETATATEITHAVSAEKGKKKED
jgi:hypothetical protein